MNLKMSITGIQLTIRAAVAAGMSVAIPQHCRFEHPIYALIAVVVTDLSLPGRVN